MTAAIGTLLEVDDLRVSFPTAGGRVEPVRGVSFAIGSSEVVGLVGESGSGKTLTARSLLRLVRAPGESTAAKLAYRGRDLISMPPSDLRAVRGAEIALVAQDPLTSLHPSLRIGTQMRHALKDHGVPSRVRSERIVQALRSVGLPDPERQAHRYPHELSGGMRQRAMIALSLVNEPVLLVADEPTTALDATVQAQLLRLLAGLRAERGLSVLLVTHNLGIVAGICDRLLIMYAGSIVESGPTAEVLAAPRHPYTQALLSAVPRLREEEGGMRAVKGAPPSPYSRSVGCAFEPRCAHRIDRCVSENPRLEGADAHPAACWVTRNGEALPALSRPAARTRARLESDPRRESETLFAVEGLTRHFSSGGPFSRETVHALDDVSFSIERGSSVGIVGESGCGKSTLVRLLAHLDRPTAGRITFRGDDLSAAKHAAKRAFRREVQIIFQDPYSSLDPRYSVSQSIAEPLLLHAICPPKEVDRRVVELLERVGLSARFAERHPRDMSGGERQRVCIARALAVEPEVLLADEPVSALDVSIQAQIVELLEELRRQYDLTLVLVAHDLALVREVCDRVLTLYLGRIAEDAAAESFYELPRHPYSFALYEAAPDVDSIGVLPRSLAAGEPPSAVNPPSGCRFHPRCWNAQATCSAEPPPLERDADGGRRLACYYPISPQEAVHLRSHDDATEETHDAIV